MKSRKNRTFIWVGLAAALLLVAGAGGVAAYLRFGGYRHACMLPPPTGNGAAMSAGSADVPLRVVEGNTGFLQRAENPLKFNNTASRVELRGVHYDGAAFAQYTVPMHGGLRTLHIDGRPIPLRGGTIEAGCIDTKALGNVIVLFSGTETVTASVVLTQDQIDRLR